MLAATLSTAAWAQIPQIRVSKTGNDVQIDVIAPGAPPYDFLRSTHPTMSVRPAFLASSTFSTMELDVGTLNDGRPLVCYVVSDANKPTITITTPVDGFSTTADSVYVAGTYSDATAVYVKGLSATLGAGTYTTSPTMTPNVPLAEGAQTITATAADNEGNFARATANGSKGFLNQTPTIAIAIDPTTEPLYTKLPTFTVTCNDPDGAPNDLDPSSFRVYVNGSDWTGFATLTGGTWQYTATPADGLNVGQNYIYATIRDNHKWAVIDALSFLITEPKITSISPTVIDTAGTLTINGAGFSATTFENNVSINGASATVLTAAPDGTQLEVSVPTNASSGPVTVAIEGMTSNPKALTVRQISGQVDIKSLHLNSATGFTTFFTDIGAGHDRLYEIPTPGTALQRNTTAIIDPIGLGQDSAGNLYYGDGRITSTNGPLHKWDRLAGTSALYRNTKITALFESTAGVYGTAVDAAGNVYTSDLANNRIKKITTALALSSMCDILDYPVNNPTGMAINEATNRLYFTTGDAIRWIPIPGGLPADTNPSTLPTNPPTSPVNYNAPFGLDFIGVDADAEYFPALVAARNGNGTVSVTRLSDNKSFDLATGLTGVRTVSVHVDTSGTNPFVTVGDATRVFNIPKPTLSLTALDGNGAPLVPIPTTVYADFDRTANGGAGADTPDVQFLDFEITTTPTTLIPNGFTATQIRWSFIDPDDPSSHSAIDLNGNGDDNRALPDAPERWTQLGSYTKTDAGIADAETIIIDGKSRVRFNLTDRPGDNYIVKAELSVPIFGTITAQTVIFTVWKKLHLEVDRMADANAPYDSTDTDDQDLTSLEMEPDTSMFSMVFLPAYVEVVRDTGYDTPNVPFKAKVDVAGQAVGVSNEDIYATVQGCIGQPAGKCRGTSANTPGYWSAYLLGGYEVADDASHHFGDNDGENEQQPLGSPTNYPFAITNNPLVSCGAGEEFYTILFYEVIRDRAKTAAGDFDIAYAKAVTPVHEVGHQFSIQDVLCPPAPCDGTDGLMEVQGPQKRPLFVPADLRWIRDRTYPHCP